LRKVKQKRFQSSKQGVMWALFLALSQISKFGIDGFQLLSRPTPADRHVEIGGAYVGVTYPRGGTLAILSAPPIPDHSFPSNPEKRDSAYLCGWVFRFSSGH
jgi:hypothetical protein